MRISLPNESPVASVGGTWADVDFDPQMLRNYFPRKAVSRDKVIAMFYNNKGADALVANSYPRAYSYFRAAAKISPALQQTWVNLGVLYRMVDEYEQGQTSFAKRLKDANDNRTEEPEKVIKEHLQDPIVGYSCRSREIPSLVKKIVSKSGVVEEYSRWSAADYASIYEEHSASTVKAVGKNKFFNSKTNLTTFINKDDTTLYDGITMKIAEKAVSDYDEYGNCRPIEICDLVPNGITFNSSNCDEIRMRPVNKVIENFNTLRRFVHLMDEKVAPNISWTAAPQLKDEKENDLLPIEVYPNKDRDVKIS